MATIWPFVFLCSPSSNSQHQDSSQVLNHGAAVPRQILWFMDCTFLLIVLGEYFVCSERLVVVRCRGQLKCDGPRAETILRLSAKRASPFKSAGASVQSTTGSRGVRISGSNAMFRGSVEGKDYPLHSPVSPSLPLPSVTVCHHISTGVYLVGRMGL